jgi:hypothetical protein
MNKTESIRTCDQCGKEVRFEVECNRAWFFNHPLAGWFKLTEQPDSKGLTDSPEGLSHDFCSRLCVVEFLRKAKP